MAFWVAVLQIIGVNIILSGDNAVVIAMACGGRPRHAIAITTALSPERMMLTPMICRTATQNAIWVKSAKRKSTSRPRFVVCYCNPCGLLARSRYPELEHDPFRWN